MPVHGVVSVLPQVGAGFVDELVGELHLRGHGGLRGRRPRVLFCHVMKPRPICRARGCSLMPRPLTLSPSFPRTFLISSNSWSSVGANRGVEIDVDIRSAVRANWILGVFPLMRWFSS